MERLTRLVLISLAILALSVPAMAAQVTITFDEPTAAANDCDHHRIYYCFGANCRPFTPIDQRFAASDANCGEADRPLGPFPLHIPQNRVPGQMCFRVTTVNTAGNESTGVTSCAAVTSS